MLRGYHPLHLTLSKGLGKPILLHQSLDYTAHRKPRFLNLFLPCSLAVTEAILVSFFFLRLLIA